MALMKLFLVICVFVVYVTGCQPPDCDHQDCGTCGNACCTVQFYFNAGTEDVYNLMVNNLKKGGADSRYTYKGGQDLRPYNTTADFILQGWHTTLKNHYNDTMDFNIISEKSGLTTVIGFSISQIAGAYCDAGQNYKNLVGFVKGLGQSFEMLVTWGCPPPSL